MTTTQKTVLLVSCGIISLGVFAVASVSGLFPPLQYVLVVPQQEANPFPVQSIDTMKFSRDMAEQVLENPARFRTLIARELQLIKNAGATHVAIGTPYDEKFRPVLRLWVREARAHGLSVWFRGNFSGWEEWFSYPRISHDEHRQLLQNFLISEANVFANGDIFSPCPECENGGPGDPRQTGDRRGFNAFLIEETQLANAIFRDAGKDVKVLTSMNADIARYVLDANVAKALGGTVLIDHYARTINGFISVVDETREILDADIGLGEFGVPIPDLNGAMTRDAQAKHLREMFEQLYDRRKHIPILNYWVLTGGSTALVDGNLSARPAYDILASYYAAPYVHGVVFNTLGIPLTDIVVTTSGFPNAARVQGSAYGTFLPGTGRTIFFERSGYRPAAITFPELTASSTRRDVYLEPEQQTLWYSWRIFLKRTLSNL